MIHKRLRAWSYVAGGLVLLCAARSEAMTITLVNGATLSANAPAAAAFERAAEKWESAFSDPITITINANLGSFGNPNIIGGANPVMLGVPYATFRNAMVADAAGGSTLDDIATFLPAAPPPMNLKAGVSYDGLVYTSKANYKAVGFTGLDSGFGTADGTITFNSSFAFDYDNSDGVGSGLLDFETVAIHEIGHVLGFLSDVDYYDGGGTPGSLGSLDLFRFNAADLPTTTAEFASKPREMRPGVAASFSSLDHVYAFSTGVELGDGRQASHWKDDALTGTSYIGIMDPTLPAGLAEAIRYADLHALDVIGYDLVPEPALLSLAALAAAGLLMRRRRAVA